MKRRVPRDVRFAQAGIGGRPRKEIIHRWMSRAKRATHKRERREGKTDVNEQRKESEEP
jgi:hypothetical protein